MSYPYFFINPNDVSGNSILLTGESFNHLANVLRAKQGDIIEVSDNRSNIYICKIAEIGKDKVILNIEKSKKIQTSLPRIILFQSIIKKNAMEYIIQKATEIGIDEIVPVISDRVVVNKKISKKTERWNKIAKAASKQSRRAMVSKVLNPVEISNIKAEDFDIFFMPYIQKKEEVDLANFLMDKDIEKISYAIGPEGGFTEREANLLIKKGAKIINFGKNILRSETAAIYFLSIIDFLLKHGK